MAASPTLQLAARARAYARTRCPGYAKGRPMRWAVARYALRVAQRPGPWQSTAHALWAALRNTPQVRTGY